MLTEREKEFLRENLDRFYEVFVRDDKDLLKSTCECCKEKREFVKELLNN